MTDSYTITEPSNSTPSTQVLIFTVLRAFLQLLGGLGIGIGANMNDGMLMVIAGVVATMGGALWSVWNKFQLAKKAHSGAVQSALVGTALQTK